MPLIATLALATTAQAGPYRWPTSPAGVNAHLDHGNLTDYACGNNTYSGHRGTDIGVGRNTQVVAAAGGTVKHRTDGFGDGFIGSTDGGGFGNVVALDGVDFDIRPGEIVGNTGNLIERNAFSCHGALLYFVLI